MTYFFEQFNCIILALTEELEIYYDFEHDPCQNHDDADGSIQDQFSMLPHQPEVHNFAFVNNSEVLQVIWYSITSVHETL